MRVVIFVCSSIELVCSLFDDFPIVFFPYGRTALIAKPVVLTPSCWASSTCSTVLQILLNQLESARILSDFAKLT